MSYLCENTNGWRHRVSFIFLFISIFFSVSAGPRSSLFPLMSPKGASLFAVALIRFCKHWGIWTGLWNNQMKYVSYILLHTRMKTMLDMMFPDRGAYDYRKGRRSLVKGKLILYGIRYNPPLSVHYPCRHVALHRRTRHEEMTYGEVGEILGEYCNFISFKFSNGLAQEEITWRKLTYPKQHERLCFFVAQTVPCPFTNMV